MVLLSITQQKIKRNQGAYFKLLNSASCVSDHFSFVSNAVLVVTKQQNWNKSVNGFNGEHRTGEIILKKVSTKLNYIRIVNMTTFLKSKN